MKNHHHQSSTGRGGLRNPMTPVLQANAKIMKYLLLILILTGCYTERKAKNQFAKAVVAYPKIPADYCANEFPVKDSIIKDTLITTDTLYADGIIYDTVFVQDFDTVRIYITKQLPGKVITNTIHIKDTIIKEGGKTLAALTACNIDKSTLTDLLKNQTDETNKYKAQAKKRGWFLWGLIALLVAIIGLNIWLRSKKIINAN